MSENTKSCEESNVKKHYKLFRVTNSFPNGDLISDYIGDAVRKFTPPHVRNGAKENNIFFENILF